WLQPREGTEDTLMSVVAGGLNCNEAKPDLQNRHSFDRELNKVSAITGVEIGYLETAAAICQNARRVVIICGTKLTEKNLSVASAVIRLVSQFGANGRVGMIVLKSAVNSQGALNAGLSKRDVRAVNPKGLYLLMSDDKLNTGLPVWLKVNDFLVVQASFTSPMTEIADVVLPSPVWSERAGTYTTMDGRTVRSNPVLKLPDGVRQDDEILRRILDSTIKSQNKS
ncbi:MAG TPA: molybdopterin-dependent oxidoreductase, partial [Dehalococcoidales bacterium]